MPYGPATKEIIASGQTHVSADAIEAKGLPYNHI
jgi:hypothetical protein